MAFPANSEVDLILALQDCAAGEADWKEFLSRLAIMTGADFAAIISGFAGIDGPETVAAAKPSARPRTTEPATLAAVLNDRTRPDRIYDETELGDLAGSGIQAAMATLGTESVRAMRVVLPGTMSVRLGIFGNRGFDASDGAVLRRLFPYLHAAARTLVRLRKKRLEAAITSELANNACREWFVLDSSCLIAARSASEPDAPSALRIIKGPQGDRLTLARRGVEGELAKLIEHAVENSQAPERAIWVGDDPALFLRIAPASQAGIAIEAVRPAVLVTLHGECPLAPDVPVLLVDLFGLLPSEARLAGLIAAGKSLAECAEIQGLTIETARSYSKRIFTKTGTRSQADLVRRIFANGVAVNLKQLHDRHTKYSN